MKCDYCAKPAACMIGESNGVLACEIHNKLRSEYTHRPTLGEEAERLLSYWEQHGDDPTTVAKWAVTDMLGILRYIIEEKR
jgi:hypothetical protein